MTRRRTAVAVQRDLFAPEPAGPAGFAYQADLIAPADEAALLRNVEALSFQPFDFHGFLAKRHVAWFGWRYDYAGGELRGSEPIPPFLLPLRARAAAFARLSPESLQQVLINKYAPGAGIGWHRDKPMFGDVIAVSLAAPCTLRLRRKRGSSWERASIHVQPRSAYLLRGEARWDWQHSIPPVDQLRYSMTFRTLVDGDL
ncbi:MAG: alpha-ketoglutarate-dependent dioxygenase AlkB [Xanthobacteraceae bacterium]|nr:alpha-ketoglutarate-dependent dioxygenase AlkB [Xanthobacteraceae bacterium]